MKIYKHGRYCVYRFKVNGRDLMLTFDNIVYNNVCNTKSDYLHSAYSEAHTKLFLLLKLSNLPD